MAYQSLYRRFRPRRFSEIRGQEHIVRALQGAVRADTVGHAYLFSGPRGTGKTTSARILAKALNCTNLHDGEPCCECEACIAIEEGRSYDLFELDAASNNGVDAMRDLTTKAAVGSPGRTKVYILDEVHMLSSAASNALLKTLEEPPEHVKFVLATTDPQKVLATIKSRTQHFSFELLTAAQLDEYVHWVLDQIDRTLDQSAVDQVVRLGKGSARDTLSALDQVLAAGGTVTADEPTADLVAALADKDAGAALTAVNAASAGGSDPRVVADSILAVLRDVFLCTVGEVDHVPESDRARIAEWAGAMGAGGAVRAIEAVGAAVVEMRQAPDPRVVLEVALVRLCTPELDTSMAALVERIAALETALASAGAPAGAPRRDRPVVDGAEAGDAGSPPPPDTAADAGAAPAGRRPPRHRSEATPAPQTSALSRVPPRRRAASRDANEPRTPTPPPTEEVAGVDTGDDAAHSVPPAADPPSITAPSVTGPSTTAGAAEPGTGEADNAPVIPGTPAPPPAAAPVPRGQLEERYAEVLARTLRGRDRAVFRGGAVTVTGPNAVTVTFPNQFTLDQARAVVRDLTDALSKAVGAPVTIDVTADGSGSDPDPGPGTPSGGAPRRAPGRTESTGRAPDNVVPLASRRGGRADAATRGREPEPTAPDAADDGDEFVSSAEFASLEDAGSPLSPVERIMAAFPGAVIVDDGAEQG